MAHVVCEPCRDCKFTDCVTVCPCDCFYEDERMLVIDPDQCIDCGACAQECPVDAIYPDTDVPARWTQYVALNAERVRVLQQSSGPITKKKEPMKHPGCTGRQSD